MQHFKKKFRRIALNPLPLKTALCLSGVKDLQGVVKLNQKPNNLIRFETLIPFAV